MTNLGNFDPLGSPRGRWGTQGGPLGLFSSDILFEFGMNVPEGKAFNKLKSFKKKFKSTFVQFFQLSIYSHVCVQGTPKTRYGNIKNEILKTRCICA